MVSDDPRTLGENALRRLLRSSTPGRLSLAGAYAWGYAALGFAQQEGTDPEWHQEIDPLDALFLGTVWPNSFRDEFQFANSRDAWLRLLRGTVHWKGIERFVHEAASVSQDLGMPLDSGELMLALVGRLEAAGLDQRRLPRRLLPGEALHGNRATRGPSPDLPVPVPPKHSKERVRRFLQGSDQESWAYGTPQAVLRDGLDRLREAGIPVEKDSAVLLPALYAALLTKPGELLEDWGEQARAWALSIDEASTLAPVLDILLVAPELGMSASKALRHLFAVPAFTEPIPSEALLWTSSPGLALPRLAFELGIPEVSTGEGTITPDLLDWAGTHARMRLSAAARENEVDLAEPEDSPVSDGMPEESGEGWDERREAVREAVLRKVRKKPAALVSTRSESDGPVERIWNADGSSVVRFSSDTPHGLELQEGLEIQLEAFRTKFGREPGPDDPLFFDPDADEPVHLTREYFDNMMLDMAQRVADEGMDPAPLHAWREVGYVVTTETMHMFTTAEVLAFNRALARHRQATA
ncbi:hypothetical protein ACIOG4_07070 [Streptomyces microflavus]|uniref:hypothetical protein n=1 Tax=Streptomyces microflavus TaxID=1919 RepID=UPI0038207172